MKKIFITLLSAVLVNSIVAQQLQHPVGLSANSNTLVTKAPDSRAWTDPALNHNRLLQNQVGDGKLVQIGNFKVKGSPFLYGQKLSGDVFSQTEKAWNIFIGYNTYNQELEFYSTSNPDQPFVKEIGELDSFVIHKNSSRGIEKAIKFVYGKHIGSNEKTYFQEVCGGDNFVFYKKYKSELAIAHDNIGQPDLRQFELSYEYFYLNKKSGKLKKLKNNHSLIVKEFESVTNTASVLIEEAYYINHEESICNAINLMNSTAKGF